MQCRHYTSERLAHTDEDGRTWTTDDYDRCPAIAKVWLVCPDGQRCPGSWMCLTHAKLCIDEYREKLGEKWGVQPIDSLGNAAPVITDNAKPLALQAILYFTMAKMEGRTRSEAVAAFIGSEMCKAFGDALTVGNVYGLAEAAGYTD